MLGLDHGMSPDPQMGVKAYVIPPPPDSLEKGVIYVSHACVGYDLGTAQLPQFLDDGLPKCRRFEIVADSADKRTNQDLRDAGFNVVGAVKGPGSIHSGLKWMKGYHVRIAPDDTPGLVALREEFKNYKHKADPKTGLKTSVILDKDNHGIDALRYACCPDHRPTPPIQFVKPIAA